MFDQPLDHAHYVTYAGAGSAVTFWGLHMADITTICALVSTLCAILGAALQFYLAMRRIKRVEKQADDSTLVAKATAMAQRATAAKADRAEAKATEAVATVNATPREVVVTIKPSEQP